MGRKAGLTRAPLEKTTIFWQFFLCQSPTCQEEIVVIILSFVRVQYFEQKVQICWVGCHGKIFWVMHPDLVNKSIFEEKEKHALLVIGADVSRQLECGIFSADNI